MELVGSLDLRGGKNRDPLSICLKTITITTSEEETTKRMEETKAIRMRHHLRNRLELNASPEENDSVFGRRIAPITRVQYLVQMT